MPNRLRAVTRACSVDQLPFEQESFTANAIQTFIVPLVDIPVFIADFPGFLCAPVVISTRCPVEKVVMNVELGAEINPVRYQRIQILFRTLSRSTGGSEKLQSVLVYAQIEEHVFVPEFLSVVSGVCVGLEELDGVSDMRNGIGVRKSSRYVEIFENSLL